MIDLSAAPTETPWQDPARFWARVATATARADAPFGVLELDALAWNAHDLLRRAGGRPIRVASKSLRVREVLESVLELDGYAGVLAYTLHEALWLSATVDDVVVGYPSADRGALAALAADDRATQRITLMVDSVEHLDLIDAVAPPSSRPEIRVALELDLSLDLRVLGHLGVRRSPLADAAAVTALARQVVERPGFRLVGLMGYEAQVAGLADRYAGRPAYEHIVAGVKRRSIAEAAERRSATVAALRELADIEFVNGGGTGSVESTLADDSVTEIAAGSGLFAGHLFDRYSTFSPAPAASFGLVVARTPSAAVATLEGGGWIASGPIGPDRRPVPVWPGGLDYEVREQAGEVQTPVRGVGLRIGDHVLFRHAKSGELAEHLAAFHLVRGGSIVGATATYRGEGRTFT